MSANQRYKESGTTKSFKQWLKDEQMKGQLEIHEKESFVNANGEEKVKKGMSKNAKVGLALLAVTLIGFGFYGLRKNKNG